MIALPTWFITGLSAPFRLAKDYPWQAACVLLALCAWWQWNRANDWHDRASAEVRAHKATKDDYRAAQAKAQAEYDKALGAWHARSDQLAQEADDANDEADLWRTRAARFADGGGLRSQAGTCAAGNAGKTGDAQADIAERSDGPGDVTLSRADFDTLTENTERLIKVHDWGESLIAEGMAVKAK